MKKHERMEEIYESGSVPWDQVDPPPEVIELASSIPAGYALDMGCGYGRSSIYLAQRGWKVDGVDFVSQAVKEATERAKQAGVVDRVNFFESAVTDIGFLTGGYDLVLDVGCAHGLTEAELGQYHQEVLKLMKPGGIFLLFAHLNEESTPTDERNWLDESTVKSIFSIGFKLEKEEHGQTQVNDQAPWRSAWFWYRKEAS
jgi:cyclopropane fatty-acyl-phospholipid synthase-like methyltransferase